MKNPDSGSIYMSYAIPNFGKKAAGMQWTFGAFLNRGTRRLQDCKEIEDYKYMKDAYMTKAKNVDEYIARQRSALAANPDCGTSHYNLAVALLGQKQFEAAEKELFAAIECSPGLAEAYVQLGGISLQRGDLNKCLEYNQQAVHARAAFAEGYGNIGFVQLQMGNIDEAIQALEKAIKFNARFLQAYATLANAYLMKGRIADSIAINLKALEIEPNFAVVHNNLAIAYLENKSYDLAVAHCDRALELGYEVAADIIEEIQPYRKPQ